MPEVEISYKIEIGTEIPKHLVELARKQGENEDSTCTKLQELKDLFYRKYFLRIFFRKSTTQKMGLIYYRLSKTMDHSFVDIIIHTMGFVFYVLSK
jgi:hypothetical protein